MKTWEIIKELADNPNLTFKNLRFGGVAGYTGVGTLSWLRNTTKDGEAFTVHCVCGDQDHHGNWNDDWELVPQEATWRDAIQAWVDGKKVFYILNGKKSYLDDVDYLRVFDGCRPISKDEISKAKWYIE